MGKRRVMEDSEEEIRRKIRELEEKLNSRKKKRRRIIYSSDSVDSDDNNSAQSEDPVPQNSPPRVRRSASRRTTGPRHTSPVPETSSSSDLGPAPGPSTQPDPEPVPGPSTQPDPEPLPGPSSAEDISILPTVEDDIQLDSEILDILGDAPESDVIFSKNIHKDVAARWQEILKKGLTKEVRENLLKEYPIPANCDLLVPPILNPETKAALFEAHIKRDHSLLERQKQIGIALAALAQATELLLSKENSVQKVLKPLADACRILCDSHHTDSKLRRNFVISVVDTSMREALLDTSRAKYLFGDNVTEKLKAAKSIQKSGEVLKVQQKNKFQKNQFITKDTQYKNRLNSKALHPRAAGKPDVGRSRAAPRPTATSRPQPQHRRATDRSPPPRSRRPHYRR